MACYIGYQSKKYALLMLVLSIISNNVLFFDLFCRHHEALHKLIWQCFYQIKLNYRNIALSLTVVRSIC